jgi:hypothetical protein
LGENHEKVLGFGLHQLRNRLAELSAVAPLWESIGNKTSSSQVPGFPVEVGGVVELHAAFLNESRTRGPVWCSVTGNPGYADFLSRLVALSNCMRLSLTKAAHAVLSGAA